MWSQRFALSTSCDMNHLFLSTRPSFSTNGSHKSRQVQISVVVPLKRGSYGQSPLVGQHKYLFPLIQHLPSPHLSTLHEYESFPLVSLFPSIVLDDRLTMAIAGAKRAGAVPVTARRQSIDRGRGILLDGENCISSVNGTQQHGMYN